MAETWTLGPLDPYPMTDQTPRTEAGRQVSRALTAEGVFLTLADILAIEAEAREQGRAEARGWNPALALIEDPDYVLAVIEDDDAS